MNSDILILKSLKPTAIKKKTKNTNILESPNAWYLTLEDKVTAETVGYAEKIK